MSLVSTNFVAQIHQAGERHRPCSTQGWQLVLAKEGMKGLEKELESEYIGRKKRKEKITPFGVNLMSSPVLYWAAQQICRHLLPRDCTNNGCLHKRCHICRNNILPPNDLHSPFQCVVHKLQQPAGFYSVCLIHDKVLVSSPGPVVCAVVKQVLRVTPPLWFLQGDTGETCM